MPIDSDEFDFELSRAAVAVACLQWLRCTGPATGPGPEPARAAPPDVAELLRNPPSAVGPTHAVDQPHPLWDRWLDG